jgi:hypothetical protein
MKVKLIALVIHIVIYANAYTQVYLRKPTPSLNPSSWLKKEYNINVGFMYIQNKWTKFAYFKEIRISLRIKNATLAQIVDELNKKSSLTVWVLSDVRSIQGRVDINLRNATITDILNFLAANFPIYYIIKDTYIAIYVKKQEVKTTVAVVASSTSNSFTFLPLVHVNYSKYSNGYQNIPKSKATDPFLQPNMEFYRNFTTAPNIVARFTQIGIPFLTTKNGIAGAQPLSFRGTNSMFGNKFALMVKDGFRFSFNSDFGNPIDIDSAWLIKTAAAGAQWGTMSANGVLVVETQSGIATRREGTLCAGITVGELPNMNYWSGLDAATTIEIEKRAYDSSILSPLSPVADVLNQAGSRGQDFVDSTLFSWKQNNFKKQLKKYFYQNSIHQQVAANLKTGALKFRNYFSCGFDEYKMPEKGNSFSRQTIFGKTTYTDSNLFFQFTGSFANILIRNNFISPRNSPPYLNFFDENGNPQGVPNLYSSNLIAFAASQGFLDASYVPINEREFSDNSVAQQYYSLAGKIGATIIKGLQARFSFQIGRTSYDNKINHPLQSFYTRNLINLYRTEDTLTGTKTWNIPPGDIFDQSRIDGMILNWRGQLDYAHKWGLFDFSAIGGIEKSSYDLNLSTLRIYGKSISFPQSEIRYDSLFRLSLLSNKFDKIPFYNRQYDSADHFFSYYTSAYVTYDEKYTLSCIARTDLSNRFDSSLNRWGIGLASGAVSWYISKENFFRALKKIDLKIRLSYGVNGNIDYTVPASRTIQQVGNQGSVSIVVPKSPQLGWEKIYICNAGVDFQFGGLITGSFDYFIKHGKELLNYRNWNPTTGYSTIKNNSGTLKGKGYDISLQTNELSLTHPIKIALTFLFTHSTNKVTSLGAISTAKPAWQDVDPSTTAPRTGFPVEALFAFKSAGLNPVNGNPRGYLNGESSEEYTKIMTATDGSTLFYVGSSVPTSLASLIPALRYKQWSLSALLSGKFGYYSWVKPLDYQRLVQGEDDGTKEYYKRWQKQGDEATTDIPSLVLPIDNSRESFSKLRTTNVIRADHARLQSVQLSYNFNKTKLPFKKLELFLSINNLGVIYRVNHRKIDPDVPIDSYPTPRSFTISLHASY